MSWQKAAGSSSGRGKNFLWSIPSCDDDRITFLLLALKGQRDEKGERRGASAKGMVCHGDSGGCSSRREAGQGSPGESTDTLAGYPILRGQFQYSVPAKKYICLEYNVELDHCL